jgi:hypothetical protein
MKLWVDDLRPPPDDSWRWAKTFGIADSILRRWYMNGWQIDVLSLDHDLGFDSTTRPLVRFMAEFDYWPTEVRVHSMNPVGREWLLQMIERYKP